MSSIRFLEIFSLFLGLGELGELGVVVRRTQTSWVNLALRRQYAWLRSMLCDLFLCIFTEAYSHKNGTKNFTRLFHSFFSTSSSSSCSSYSTFPLFRFFFFVCFFLFVVVAMVMMKRCMALALEVSTAAAVAAGDVTPSEKKIAIERLHFLLFAIGVSHRHICDYYSYSSTSSYSSYCSVLLLLCDFISDAWIMIHFESEHSPLSTVYFCWMYLCVCVCMCSF